MKACTALIICALAIAANAAASSPSPPPLTVVSYDALVEGGARQRVGLAGEEPQALIEVLARLSSGAPTAPCTATTPSKAFRAFLGRPRPLSLLVLARSMHAPAQPPPVLSPPLLAELTAAIITKYQTGVNTLDSLSTSWSSSLNQLTEQLAAGYAAYSTQFCTAPEFELGACRARPAPWEWGVRRHGAGAVGLGCGVSGSGSPLLDWGPRVGGGGAKQAA